MDSPLTHWTTKLTRLRTDKNHNRWDAATSWRAPHKPFLLLAVMDLMEAGRIAENRVQPTRELVEAFTVYWETLFPKGKATTMAYPFPRLQGDGVLTLVPLPGISRPTAPKDIHSLHRLRSCYSHAQLDETLYRLMLQPDTREALRAAIIDHYFDPTVKPVILSRSTANKQTGKYARYLLDQGALEPSELKEITRSFVVRDRGFRSALLPLYDHRCAICKIRVRTPEEHHVVDAAHIIPYSDQPNDAPTNGLTLCKLCHWAFDEGMIGISEGYTVMTSRHLTLHGNAPGNLASLKGSRIVLPEDSLFFPSQDNLEVHRSQRFDHFNPRP